MRYDNAFIAIDTETGGLLSKIKKAVIDIALTEVALVTVENESLEIIDKQSWLVKPYDENVEYTPRAAEVSGISKQMCEKEGLDIELVYKNVLKVLKKAKMGSKKPIIIMQNKAFDTPFLENLFAIFGDDFNNHIDRIEDTLFWARYKWIEKPNYGLGSIAEYCGLDLVQAHRALPDTEMTAKIWIHFMKSLRNEIGGSEQQSVEKFREGFKF